MRFLELRDIAEQSMKIVNPMSPQKIVQIGEALNLTQNDSVIDLGCGHGELLALWGEQFGISGLGVDIRHSACDRARARLTELGLSEKLAIVQAEKAAPQDRP